MATLVKSLAVTDKATAQALRQQLKALRAPQTRRFRWALGLALSNVALLIGQYAVLAWLLNQWLQASLHDSWQTIEPTRLYAAGVFLVSCLLIRPLLHYWRERLCQQASLQIRQGLRQRLLALLTQPSAQLAHSDSEGALASQILDQVDALDGYLQRYVVQAQLAVLAPLLLLIVVFPLSPLAGALLLLTAPLVPLFMIILGQAAANSSRRQLQALSRLSGRFLDLIRGMKGLQQLQATDLAQQQVADSVAGYRERTMAVLRLAFLSSAVLEFFAALSIALVAVYLGLGLLGLLPWAKEQIPVPYASALFILLLAPEFYAPLRQLGSDYHAKADAEAALTELQPLLNAGAVMPQGEQPYQAEGAPEISLQAVRVLSAAGRARLAVDEITVAAAQRVLIQGESGAGKTTLLHVLLGGLAYQGQVRVNQQDLQQLNRQDWLNQLDYLSQNPRFISGTLADNLRLAKPSATDAQLIKVLEQVGLAEHVSVRGLQLPLFERGLGLSGGQLSRVALAQLLLRDRPLWLLDEPTAHLDDDSQLQIHALLERLSRGKTLLLVSHSAAGLDWVDQVVRLTRIGGQNDAL